MMRTHRATRWVILVSVLLLAPACGRTGERKDSAGGGFKKVAPKEAFALVQEHAGDSSFEIVDVRTPREFETERITGARNLDFHSPQFRDDLSRLDRSHTFLIYCRTGNRSTQTLPILRDLGFAKVVQLEGGIRAWKDAAQPVEVSAPVH